MGDKDKKILLTCDAMIPQMTERDKDRFLAYMEGMAFITAQRNQNPAQRNQNPAQQQTRT